MIAAYKPVLWIQSLKWHERVPFRLSKFHLQKSKGHLKRGRTKKKNRREKNQKTGQKVVKNGQFGCVALLKTGFVGGIVFAMVEIVHRETDKCSGAVSRVAPPSRMRDRAQVGLARERLTH